jgi:hypothetical protein
VEIVEKVPFLAVTFSIFPRTLVGPQTSVENPRTNSVDAHVEPLNSVESAAECKETVEECERHMEKLSDKELRAEFESRDIPGKS